MPADTLACYNFWELLATDGQKPVMRFSILQCAGQLLTTNNYMAQIVSSTKIEKSCI